eukprot:CAMPEP_0171075124 /NCGR_PEP_ID=MMETSP0766_2-20121228/12584_1 /TAXON_ID=439317 /ORGANISM="Gambierdiscus australes, Strain CAWD 149" /LENGTH=162 /DNA_ID=CAMNT_0011531965 /DNA_START=643 /DNA_END=1131 /DNA_ORIENTATION=-
MAFVARVSFLIVTSVTSALTGSGATSALTTEGEDDESLLLLSESSSELWQPSPSLLTAGTSAGASSRPASTTPLELLAWDAPAPSVAASTSRGADLALLCLETPSDGGTSASASSSSAFCIAATSTTLMARFLTYFLESWSPSSVTPWACFSRFSQTFQTLG